MERKYGEELKPFFGTVTSVSKFKCGLVEGDILFYIGNVMNKTTLGCFFFRFQLTNTTSRSTAPVLLTLIKLLMIMDLSCITHLGHFQRTESQQ